MLVPLALLFIAIGVPSYAQTNNNKFWIEMYQFELGRGILLNCSTADASPGAAYTWTKNGTSIEQLEELKDRYELLEAGAVLRVKPRPIRQNDSGEYKCHLNGTVVHVWRVYTRPVAKLPSKVDVLTGQRLKVNCKLVGKPYLPVQWLYAPLDSDNATMVPVEDVAGTRVALHDNAWGVPHGELVLEGVTHADAGNYSCKPYGGYTAYTTVRVLDDDNEDQVRPVAVSTNLAADVSAVDGQKKKVNCNCTCSCN